MPFHELIRVTCDDCGDALIVPQTSAPNGTLFHSHAQAIRAAEQRDWYVDAKTVRCPEHWPGTMDITITDVDPDTDIDTSFVHSCRYCHLPAIPGLTTCAAHSRRDRG